MWPHDLKCPTNLFAPEPVGVCDRCYAKAYLSELEFQFDYAGGNNLTNLRIRVCSRCRDVPADQRRPIVITGPEGTVRDPRPPQYAVNALGGTVPPSPVNQIFPDGAPFPAGSNYLLSDDGEVLLDNEGKPLIPFPKWPGEV